MRSRAAGLILATLVLTLAACERDEIVNVDPEQAPGQSGPTLESVLEASGVTTWIDTVFEGFARPSGAPFILVEEGTPELMSRGLIGFNFIVDSVALPDTISPVLRFEDGRVVLGLDTTVSRLASAGTTLQLRTLEQSWDARTATWELAVDSLGLSEPWTAGPGGTLGQLLSEVTLTEFPDSIVLPLGEKTDSLIRLWNDTIQPNPGLALVVADSGRIKVGSTAQLRYNNVPELSPDTAIEFRVFATATTFIFDRSSPALPPGVLRVGGVEGWRSFMQVVLPDSIAVLGSGQRFRLRGSTINEAELVLTSLAPPAAPFGAESPFELSAFELADDFTRFGPKTPVGPRIAASSFILFPDSVEAGESITIDITDRLQAFSDVPVDLTPPPLRLLLRARAEATTLGFWEFGAIDGDPSFVPKLRIVFTPDVEFQLP